MIVWLNFAAHADRCVRARTLQCTFASAKIASGDKRESVIARVRARINERNYMASISTLNITEFFGLCVFVPERVDLNFGA